MRGKGESSRNKYKYTIWSTVCEAYCHPVIYVLGHLDHHGHLDHYGHHGHLGYINHLGHLGHQGHLGHLDHLGQLGHHFMKSPSHQSFASIWMATN